MVVVQARAGGVIGTGWTYGSAACAAVVTGMLADVVRGRTRWTSAARFEAMVRAVRNVGRPGAVGYAISAVDVALWDLKARLLGTPCPGCSARCGSEVPVYGSGGFTTYGDRQLHDQLSGWVLEQRIPRVKIKIGESWGRRPDETWNASPRPARSSATETELFVDANGGYSASRPSGSCRPPLTRTCAGSRNRSPPTTWTGCGRSGTPSSPT